MSQRTELARTGVKPLLLRLMPCILSLKQVQGRLNQVPTGMRLVVLRLNPVLGMLSLIQCTIRINLVVDLARLL